jgi:LacI family transcriptional regulator
MRQRVSAVIDRLGYRPHTGARAMRGSSYTVGVLLAQLAAPFQVEIAEGISDHLQATPYQEVIVSAGLSPERQIQSVEALIDRNVDGLILVAPWMSTDWIEALARKVPTVVIARHGGATQFDTVIDDDERGARLMVAHLVGLGHRRIAHISEVSGGLRWPFVLPQTARQRGYEQAMTEHGLEPDVLLTGYSVEGGYEGAREALSRAVRPTAVFGGADTAALGALRAAEELGLRVPADVSIAGYDDIAVAGLGRISLTTVDQDGHLTGAVSARLLQERIEGRTTAVQYVVSPTLIPRETSGPVSEEAADRRRSAVAEVA